MQLIIDFFNCVETVLHLHFLDMPMLEKYFGRLVALVLLSLFIWRVVLSLQLLLDRKIASSESNQYSNWRLIPSLSICVALKNVIKEELLENIDDNLQRVLEEAVISLRHLNISESG